MTSQEIINEYPNLSEVLEYDSLFGLEFKFQSKFQSQITHTPKNLKYYYYNESTKRIIDHNLQWALGNKDKPKFQFVYLMLPTHCNQKCYGCFMGHDDKKLPDNLTGSFFNKNELDSLLDFAIEHHAEAIVYGGGGELFTWKGAVDYIKYINDRGLRFVVFTNGTLLDESKLKILNDLKTSIIVSLRDTNEFNHNKLVGGDNFKKALKTIDIAIDLGFTRENRLAIEIPATTENENRILSEFLLCLRYLNITPMIEEFLQYGNENKELCNAHNFSESRKFFELLSQKDKQLGFNWSPELGSRILGQPKCQRPLHSFTVFPNRDVADCPAGFKIYGNLVKNSIENIIYSNQFKKEILDFKFCACSVFYSEKDEDIPEELKEIYS